MCGTEGITPTSWFSVSENISFKTTHKLARVSVHSSRSSWRCDNTWCENLRAHLSNIRTIPMVMRQEYHEFEFIPQNML